MFRRIIFGLGLCVFGFVFFLVPLGEHTLFEHIWRIAQTDEARELGNEVKKKAASAGKELGDEVQARYPGAKDKVADMASNAGEKVRDLAADQATKLKEAAKNEVRESLRNELDSNESEQ